MTGMLKEVLFHSLKRLGYERQLKERMAMLVWHEIAGDTVTKHTRPDAVHQGILFVVVDSPAWAHQLTFLKHDLLGKLAQRLGSNVIKDIRFQAGTLKKEEMSPQSKPPGEQASGQVWEDVQLSESELAKINEAVNNINDQPLRQRVRQALISLEKLQHWKVKNRWKKCACCRALHQSDQQYCPVCQLGMKNERRQKLSELLNETPWLSYNQCVNVLPLLTTDEYEEVKQECLRYWWNRITELAKKKNKGMDLQKLRIYVHSYVMCKTGLPPEKINRQTIEAAAGENINGMLEKEVVNHC